MSCTRDEVVADLVADFRTAGISASGEVHASPATIRP